MPLTTRVRVGVIGTSEHTQSVHLASLKSHPGADVVAICGRDQARARRVAAAFEIPGVFADYRRMIEAAEIDLLVVVAPDDLHYPITLDALDRGLHVLCEKPLARNLAEARRMYERAEAVGVKHMTFFSWRWPPAQRFVKQLIDNGYVGRGFDASLSFCHGFGRDDRYSWRFDGARSAGVLGDLGSHLIDLVRWYFGEVTGVSARLTHVVDRRSADGMDATPTNDAGLLTLQLAGGAQAAIQVSALARVADREVEQRIVVHGSEGSLEASYSALGTEVRGTRDGDAAFRVLPIPDELWGDADRTNPLAVLKSLPVGDRQMIDAILADRPVTPSFYDGMKTQEVIDAALRSDREGRWVEANEFRR
ncbi:MAG: Gfo/Idh/MocA family protein [Chloroflexota bacterium]